MSEEKGFCVNCNKQDCDLICEGCTERNLLFHENKLISEFAEWIDYILNSFEGDIPRVELEAEKNILEEKLK